MSLASAPSDDNDPHPPVTLDSQGISIGPMTMMCFTRLQILKKFSSPEKQHVKGLNYEAVIPVRFPSPAWIKATEYAALQLQTYNDDDGNDVNCAFFSLNLSIYNQEVIPSDWDDTCISLPTLNLDITIIPPIVTSSGSVVGSGRTLLRGDPPSGLSETQQKCCGFVQLSTFITPGNSTRPPYRRAHQFQAFAIFPIHVNPWMIRCKKMMERPNTQFQPNTLFHCTGRLAGFLDHRIIVHPPSLAQDYVFIIVPENWDFFAKSSKNTISTAYPIASTAKQSSADPRSKFMSPKKRKPDQLSDPETPKTSPDRGATMTISSRRLAGFLDHRIMVHPPSLAQDYVFIIVPENWEFFAKSSKNTISTASPIDTPAKQSSADPRSKFMSPSKRKPDQLSDPETPKISPDRGASVTTSSPQTPSTSHTTDMSGILASPSHKRPRAENTLPTSPTHRHILIIPHVPTMLPNHNHLDPNLLSLQISFHNPPFNLLLFPPTTAHIEIVSLPRKS
ncbi:hypothetical protein DM02DRAFT_734164 [Periconia macrospinosa]|uniref:Uncharacterized protein n=1 Tax=Periconia macrospinosa TaxID=97972 RepID=A0A2V1D1H8_9PLEO|nr:hypothetical protein DM02DRAFT_734164 [Periconia macrospinosa]